MSNKSQDAFLVVYKDYIESNGKWRLFWADVDAPFIGVNEQSTVTGQPFFDTRKQAIAYAKSRYGIIPETAAFHQP